MIAKNCTDVDLYKALRAVNTRFQGNIKFKTFEEKGKRYSFTLTVIDSKAPGHRRKTWGPKPGRIAAACWHVHGYFFEELFKIQPLAGVLSSGSLANPTAKRWITIDGGNWQDRNMGSMINPVMWSQACDCGPLHGARTFLLSQDMIKRCPSFIMTPEHYKADGTCLCFDIDEQARIKQERLDRRAKTLANIARQKGGK
jgi:hypothetical protein